MSPLNLPHGTHSQKVSPEEEKERLRWGGIAGKEGFKPGMKSEG